MNREKNNTRKIYNNGGSFRIRTIPLEIVKKAGLKSGQIVDFEVKDGKIIITPLNEESC